jgi:hypothetical protein
LFELAQPGKRDGNLKQEVPMSTVIVIVVIIVVIAALVAAAMTARRRRLQQKFGPEYDRAVSEQNSKLRAEAELTDRQRRVRKLDIRPLSEASRTRYAADWVTVQERFVDSPESAVADAYSLVTTVMQERGYPIGDDEQVLSDLSVEHAQTVGHFRAAQEISRNAAVGSAATEDLRQALIHYRALFSDLLGEPGQTAPAADAPADATAADAAVTDAPVSQTAYPESTYSDGETAVPVSPAGPDSVSVGTPVRDQPESQR